ncbi:uncharacterized protein (DUF1501 family) [Dyadobacter sp. BE34]|uniref:Uncharacterized protein (DUF1501 family) n=1 Tax=Dyadobacter fermentans TaxID=94254 RepID=A0ABU1R767_9BACT|nr:MULTISPECIES: DUF1501 domain-containing protein [Dyadobacter]MDR6809246.1 uncharacterized protein (DUF1501 family) [Dyadobacter fermentans]MDR7046989.1 uncharacterized protein (DUF1501 family) [Dyadobacter sp. BE242]MDR7201303.1 uncharacterized protein (DUF1501 family) [Dyadobacter sp. BE34]MDR7219263.1 uncharacterized protein (DUF1501 family) [Dyadobacter sp. BE31]MDR7264527.1 uncharacterized protein (DUF1501 family) [Dyadobacter sp. BE32]
MKRRDFITAATALVAPVVLDGFGIKSLAKGSALVRSLRQTAALNGDRVLVIIYLAGGNDGLNTVIPLEYYSQYNALRTNIAIPESSVLKLSGNPQTGFHPAMTGMRALYDEGKLAIINSVSYPNPDLSHYRSTDIWMTAVESTQYASSGWAGRYLNDRFPGYPDNYPNAEMEDPLAIQIGQINTTTLVGGGQGMGVTIQDPASFYQLIGESTAAQEWPVPCCDAGDLLKFIRQKQTFAVDYAAEIKRAADAGKNLAVYPDAAAKNELADQLKIVARLIHGGLKSKIYYVELGGFDTHSGQVGTSSTEGIHAQLLKKLSDAIAAFQNDLKLQATETNVLGMTFSDFGRRATSNASKGTDHGVGAPMFVFGTGIKRQLVGTNPDLVNGLLPVNPAPGAVNRDIKMQIDFRRVYSDVLNDWFGTDRSKTDQILYRNFPTTSLFSEVVWSMSSGAWHNPEVWSSGRVPTAKDVVRVVKGHKIDVGPTATAKSVKVETGGELKFLGDYTINVTG